MEINEKINKIEEMLEIDVNTLTLETELNSLDEWDSVAILSTIVMLDEEFGKTIKGTDIKACKTVADLVNLM
ncbi:acyl carrier protein [uncultured Prevotella sp.]|uniref:acyl carrier protein n=1 Tax=uncultured Prevotella sp. TaxID=159272 RepID=UPI002587B01E|nr:acyl carrier protein [uncultured Prevotella sp.]